VGKPGLHVSIVKPPRAGRSCSAVTVIIFSVNAGSPGRSGCAALASCLCSAQTRNRAAKSEATEV